MPNPNLARRLEILEEKVDALENLHAEFTSFRAEVRERFDNVDKKFDAVDKEFTAVREEIGDTRREMRVLHEDVISRIALLQEGIDRRNSHNTARRSKKTARRKR